MKVVIGTLLLTFVILLSSIQLSTQSDHRNLPETETFENIPSGRNIRLSNGHTYRSLGSGMIRVQYNTITGDAYIREGGRVSRTDSRVLPTEEYYEHIPAGRTINLANGHPYTSLGTGPIAIRYNTVSGIAYVRQGNSVVVLGEEGFGTHFHNM